MSVLIQTENPKLACILLDDRVYWIDNGEVHFGIVKSFLDPERTKCKIQIVAKDYMPYASRMQVVVSYESKYDFYAELQTNRLYLHNKKDIILE